MVGSNGLTFWVGTSSPKGEVMTYSLSTEQMAKITSVLGKALKFQVPIFTGLDFNPYDDEGIGSLDSIVMERERYESERKERIGCPLDYGVCDTEERAEEIKAGAALTDEEEQMLNNDIFDQDDTYMVVTEMSDGNRNALAVNVQQMWGQGGLHVIDFLGFFANHEDAQKAIEAADYVTFEGADGRL
jgi:hypothetical protein